MISSQNVEDFLLPEIKEFTKPLFSIPTHQFYFNPGNIEVQAFIDTCSLKWLNMICLNILQEVHACTDAEMKDIFCR